MKFGKEHIINEIKRTAEENNGEILNVVNSIGTKSILISESHVLNTSTFEAPIFNYLRKISP